MPEQPSLIVDARGHRCPTPTLRLRRALETTAPGDEVLLLADDPLAKIDIRHFAAAQGHELVSLTFSDTVITAVVRKGD